jgi:hypothetical protein
MDIELKGKKGGINRKALNMKADKAGIERSLVAPFPKFAIAYNLIYGFLGGRLLSLPNIMYAEKQIRRLREHPAFQDLSFQKEIDCLDARLNAAKDRHKRRVEWRVAQKYERDQAKAEGRAPRNVKEFGDWKPGGRGRPPKKKDAAAVPAPSSDLMELWSSMLKENKQ